MSCQKCGRQTPRRVCRDCTLDERFEQSDSNQELYSCPRCGSPTSGQDVICFRCRSEEGDE